MDRVALGLVLALVVSPGLAGCLADPPPEDRPSTAVQAPTLPAGITVQDATATRYDEHAAVLEWEATTSYWSDGYYMGIDGAPEPAMTELQLPSGADYHLLFQLTWEASHDLDLVVRDENGASACQARGGSNDPPEVCEIRWLPASNETRAWRIEVLGDLPVQDDLDPSAFASDPDIPFTLTVRVLATGPFGIPVERAGGGTGS